MTITEIRKIREIPIMFIMGKERSGTTMLQSILNTHPNIVAPPESRIIIFMYAKFGHITRWTDSVLEEFCDELYEETRFRLFWNIDKEDLLKDFISVKNELTYAWIFKIIYCKMAPDKDVKLIFDKNPMYHSFVPELQEVYKDAKFIHIVRDYRDNIVSHQRILPSRNSAQLAYRWLMINSCLDLLQAKQADKWITVKYESLVAEPLKYIEEVCAFIKLPFYKNMVTDFSSKLSDSFYKNIDRKGFTKFHSNLYNPVNTGAMEQWKTAMPNNDIQVAEAIAGAYGEKMYGYKTTMPYKKVGVVTMIKAKIVFRFFNSLLRFAYTNRFSHKAGIAIAGKYIHKENTKTLHEA